MKIIIVVISFFLITTSLISNDTDISISNVKVMKRNKPTCDRLGNIYDACQWMLKFKINNNTENDLMSFCSVIKVNKNMFGKSTDALGNILIPVRDFYSLYGIYKILE